MHACIIVIRTPRARLYVTAVKWRMRSRKKQNKKHVYGTRFYFVFTTVRSRMYTCSRRCVVVRARSRRRRFTFFENVFPTVVVLRMYRGVRVGQNTRHERSRMVVKQRCFLYIRLTDNVKKFVYRLHANRSQRFDKQMIYITVKPHTSLITITTTGTKYRSGFFDNFPIDLNVTILGLVSRIVFRHILLAGTKTQKYIHLNTFIRTKKCRCLRDRIVKLDNPYPSAAHEAQSFFRLIFFFLSKGQIKVSFGTRETFARMCANVKPPPRSPR